MVSPPNWKECSDRIQKERLEIQKKNKINHEEMKARRVNYINPDTLYQKCATKTSEQLEPEEQNLYNVVNKSTSILTSLVGGEIRQIGSESDKMNANAYDIDKFGTGVRFIEDINMGNNVCQDINDDCNDAYFSRYSLTTPEQAVCDSDGGYQNGVLNESKKKLCMGITNAIGGSMKQYKEGTKPNCALVNVNVRLPKINDPNKCDWDQTAPFVDRYEPVYLTVQDIEKHYKTCGRTIKDGNVTYKPCITDENGKNFNALSIAKLKGKSKKCKTCSPLELGLTLWRRCSNEKDVIEKQCGKKESFSNYLENNISCNNKPLILLQSMIGSGLSLFILHKLLQK